MNKNDICNSFDASANELPNIDESLFKYDTLTGDAHDETVLKCLKKITTDTQVIGAPSRKTTWNNGWNENLESFLKYRDVNSITPKYIRPGQIVRLQQSFVIPRKSQFEKYYVELFQKWFFAKYLEKCSTIYEFGCGSGFNLVAMQDLFVNKKMIGLDFSESSVKLINEIGKYFQFDVSGVMFDMINPNRNIKLIGDNVGVLTCGSIEQLASKFHDFITYLINQKPSICLHVEPVVELYDNTNLVDWLAIQFHRKRGYTEGLLPYLQKLHSEKKIELIKYKRLYFGSLFMEGYNYIIWRPL